MIPFQVFDQMGRQLHGSLFNRGTVTELGLMSIKPSVVSALERYGGYKRMGHIEYTFRLLAETQFFHR